MKATPKESRSGDFLKTEDIGKEAGDMKTAIILRQDNNDSVIFVDNPFSKTDEDKQKEQILIDVQGIDDSKNFSLSPTNWNKLIDILGDDTEKWINQKIGLVLTANPVKQSSTKLIISIRTAK